MRLLLATIALATLTGCATQTHAAPCDQETGTHGNTVTYGAGTPGCTPNTVTYAH